MNRTLNLTGKNSNEIYALYFPRNLIKFIKYDFTVFMERCTDLCRISMKKGEYPRDEAAALRNSISPCHKYYEKNMRGVFEKIVADCWIEYICRQNEINAPTLWNSFSSCKNEFERAIFARLCEYRYNYAINQWVNILKIQEYAGRKVEFIFGKKLAKFSMASARAGYFDLLFNVAANEMGYSRDGGACRVCSSGRIPNSPFVMSGVSREIMRNILTDLRYGEESGGDGRAETDAGLSDKTDMDAFAAVKAYIPEESDSIINTIIKSIPETPSRVYIPESFRAVIDLEIDALIESGAVIQRCARCREYFLRDEEYDFDYCSVAGGDGRTCLDAMSESGNPVRRAVLADTSVLYARCDRLYKEMAERVNADITQRDFSDWYRYMTLIRENIVNGSASMDDFENFAEYSRTISFPSRSRAILYKDDEPAAERAASDAKKKSKKENGGGDYDKSGREIRPFVFEKIDRSAVPEKRETLGDLLGVSTAVPYAVNPGYYPVNVPAAPPPPPIPKVIKGVIPAGVNVVGINNHISSEAKPPETDDPPGFAPEPEPPAAVSETRNDVKVYSREETAGDKIDDFVRVYQTGAVNNRGRGRKKTAETDYENETRPANAKYEKGSLLKNPFIREIIKVDDANESGGGETLDAPPAAKPESVEEKTVSRQPPLLSFERPGQPDKFSEILSGIERKDGFESEDESPAVSHKTKRVMDAIFKKSAANPFVNPEEPFKDEDYD
ncbi:MAG: hypothetical protein LBI38_05465 [Oscillospiraceae bacterium]|nr:hypothetical protein [Oscillospiraceae bacterium]